MLVSPMLLSEPFPAQPTRLLAHPTPSLVFRSSGTPCKTKHHTLITCIWLRKQSEMPFVSTTAPRKAYGLSLTSCAAGVLHGHAILIAHLCRFVLAGAYGPTSIRSADSLRTASRGEAAP